MSTVARPAVAATEAPGAGAEVRAEAGGGVGGPGGEPAATDGIGSSVANWSVTAVSVPGSKRAPDEPCEDAHAWALQEGWLVAAVADGAGSASRAAAGAGLASRFFVEHFCWVLAEEETVSAERIIDSFEATRRALEGLRHRTGGRLADFATTLTVAVAGPRELWAAQVGDGAAVVRCGDDLVALATTSKGEFLNETTFLTSSGWRQELAVECRHAGPAALALITDGLGLLALDLTTGAPHAPFFEPLFAFCRGVDDGTAGIERFLRSDRVGSRTDDDLTLLIALPS